MFWTKFRLVVEEKNDICQCGMPCEVVLRSNKDLRDVSIEKITAAATQIIAKEIIPLLDKELIQGAAQLPDVTDIHTELAEYFLRWWGVPREDPRKVVVRMNCPGSVVADAFTSRISQMAFVAALTGGTPNTEPVWDGSPPYAEA